MLRGAVRDEIDLGARQSRDAQLLQNIRGELAGDALGAVIAQRAVIAVSEHFGALHGGLPHVEEIAEQQDLIVLDGGISKRQVVRADRRHGPFGEHDRRLEIAVLLRDHQRIRSFRGQRDLSGIFQFRPQRLIERVHVLLGAAPAPCMSATAITGGPAFDDRAANIGLARERKRTRDRETSRNEKNSYVSGFHRFNSNTNSTVAEFRSNSFGNGGNGLASRIALRTEKSKVAIPLPCTIRGAPMVPSRRISKFTTT